MKRLFLVVPLLICLLFGSAQQSYASKVTNTVNIEETFIDDNCISSSYSSHNFSYITEGNAHIVSAKWSYGIELHSSHKAYTLDAEILGNGSPGFAFLDYTTPDNNRDYSVYANNKTYDTSGSYISSLYTSLDPWCSGTITLHSVTVDEYAVDNVVLSNTDDGYVKITVTQSSPEPKLTYTIINANDGRTIATKSGVTTSSFTVNDVAPVRGSVNTYRIQYKFPCGNPKTYTSSGINVPIDTLTYKSVTNSYGNTIDAVRDANGTVLQAARDAKNSANSAKTSADAAKSEATSAKNQSWYSGKYGGSTESVADVAGYIRNTQLPSLENKIANLETNINNNFSNDKMAPIITKVEGQDGATCTTGNSYTLVVTASDNGPASNLRYKAGSGNWTSNNNVTITPSKAGANTVTIYVSDNPTSPDDGNIAQTSFTYFKI